MLIPRLLSFVSPAVTWDGFQEDKGLKKMKGRTSGRRYLTAMFFMFFFVYRTGAQPQSKPRKLPPDRSNSMGAPRKLHCPAVHSFDLNTSVRPELVLELVVAALRT